MTPRPATFLAAPRLPWSDAPAEVRTRVSEHTGSILRWSDQTGGLSTGVAAVVHGERHRVFVKALDSTHNPTGGELYRREAELAAHLSALPYVPGLLESTEVETATGSWIINLFPAVLGSPPPHPWRTADLLRVLDCWVEVRAALPTIPAPDQGLGTLFDRWQQIAADPDDPWHRHLADWPAREQRFRRLLDHRGGQPWLVTHSDLRADNIVLADHDQKAWFVDWAHPHGGAPWVDPLLLFADVIASGADRVDGGELDAIMLWTTHPAGDPDAELLIDGVAAYAAFMHVGSRKPINPVVPNARQWQATIATGLLPFLTRHSR